jgi:hypothetical protein
LQHNFPVTFFGLNDNHVFFRQVNQTRDLNHFFCNIRLFQFNLCGFDLRGSRDLMAFLFDVFQRVYLFLDLVLDFRWLVWFFLRFYDWLYVPVSDVFVCGNFMSFIF